MDVRINLAFICFQRAKLNLFTCRYVPYFAYSFLIKVSLLRLMVMGFIFLKRFRPNLNVKENSQY